MAEHLDWTNIALVGFIVFVTIILLVVFCRWLRRDNEERAYRSALEKRRQGFYMVQDPANMGVWEVYSMVEEGREMQQLSHCAHHTPQHQVTSPPEEGSRVPSEPLSCKGVRRASIPIAKKRLPATLEAISESLTE